MEIVNLNKKVPSEREIADLEIRLAQMKKAREEAKRRVVEGIKAHLADLPDALDSTETITLMKLLQTKLKGGHKKIRGNPVPAELRANLESALKERRHTLSQLEKMFGLSVSYISRVKKELGLAVPRYTDQQLSHQQPAREAVAA